MKYIIFLLTILFSVSLFADDDILVKTDGTKYYIQVYDGVTNEKVLQYEEAPGWKYRIFTGDYFDGSDKQLWSFEATDMFPGYFSIVNHHFGFTHHLMSYNWFAYFTDAANRDPKTDKEMQFKFVDVGDGYFKLETIEKPTDGSLYGINYTPGADALNVDENGRADFGDVKSADIVAGNWANKVFKVIEFNPMALFEESIVRGDELYKNNSDAPEKVLFDLFYVLEKAREIRVFGQEAEMLAFQTEIDSVMNLFNQSIGLLNTINDAKTFIDGAAADEDLKSAFRGFVDEAEAMFFADDFEYTDISSISSKINQAKSLVNAIIDAQSFIDNVSVDNDLRTAFTAIIGEAKALLAANDIDSDQIGAAEAKLNQAKSLVNAIIDTETYKATISELDPRYTSIVDFAIVLAEAELAKGVINAEDIGAVKSTLSAIPKAVEAIEEAIALIVTKQTMVEASDDPELAQIFEVAKGIYEAEIEAAIVALNVAEINAATIDEVMGKMKAAKKAFESALEAGDTVVELLNANFDNGKADWNTEATNTGWAYPSEKGVDGSASITCWSGSAYDVKVFQSISNIPNGTYRVSCFADVNYDNSIGLYAKSGEETSVLPLIVDGGLVQRDIDIVVDNGMLEFGIKGLGENNGIPGKNWVVFDQFELKWLSNITIKNANFNDGVNDWTRESPTPNAAYASEKGVDGSASVTCWSSAAYQMKFYQSVNVPNGTYAVSAMANTNVDGAFVIFGESAGTIASEVVLTGGLSKTKATIEVTDGVLKFGAKGAGVDNAVPASNWVVLDDFEVVRLPNIPIVNAGFESDFSGWVKESSKSWMPYIEQKGVGGSKSVTFWQSADYYAFTHQTISGLFNGSYEVAAMTKSPNDGSFSVYGKSAEVEFNALVAASDDFVKTKALAVVSDGSLEFGVHGSGEGATAPAGNWIVFDDVELLIKTISPLYVSADIQQVATSTQTLSEPESITYAQFNGYLNVRSSQNITQYTVYSLNGSRIDQKQTYGNEVSIPMTKGVFVVRLVTNDGMIHNKKVFIK